MFNGVLLVAIIATWILKVTSLPILYYRIIQNYQLFAKRRDQIHKVNDAETTFVMFVAKNNKPFSISD